MAVTSALLLFVLHANHLELHHFSELEYAKSELKSIMSAVEANVDNLAGDDKPKTAKQLEKDAKKAAKLAKLQEKLDKQAAVAPATKEKVDVSF